MCGYALLADEGHEGGNITPGLGWISGKVRHFSDCLTDPESRKLKIPHMGWNSLSITRDSHPVCASLPRNVQMYFVHSYVFDDAAEDQLLAVAHYGMAVPALIGRDNIIGTHFIRKSQQVMAMLDRFYPGVPEIARACRNSCIRQRNEMTTQRTPLVTVEMVTELSANDISELRDATEEAIEAGGGFGWLAPPPRSVLEDYWRGILLVPDYHLFLGKLDHVIAGSCQIVRLPRNNEAQATTRQLRTFFLAPWARGHGLAQALVAEAEEFARSEGYQILNLMYVKFRTEPSEPLKHAAISISGQPLLCDGRG